jgi:hypothetical protein
LAADALQATFLAALARVNDTIRGRGCSTSPRGVAILSASQFTEPERRTELVEAFNSWYDEVTEAGHEMAIPQQLVEQLKQYDQTYVHIGQWYLGRHNPEKAQQYYSIAYMGHRQSVLRSQVLANMGRHDEAREVYREVTDVKWAAGLRGYVDQAKATLN